MQKMGLCLALVSLLVASGCVRQTEILKTYERGEDADVVYQRLLVVDVSSNPDRQQRFEDEIVKQLLRKGVGGVAAHTNLRFAGGIPLEDITSYGDSVNADAILLTRFASVESSFEIEEGREKIQSSCRRGSPADYFLYDYDIVREPDAIKAAYQVVVVSSLYDVSTRERVWSIQSSCFDKPSMSEALLEEARAIVGQLRSDELI